MPHLIVFALLAALTLPAAAQKSASVGFWNVENLFDTIPNPFGGDGDYTPGGRMKWSGARYEAKLAALARVIDDASFDVLGLCEVENEEVVRDLADRLGTDYTCIHRTSRDPRGIEQALLYKGDRFFPEAVRLVASGFSREFLYVRGELMGSRVDLLVCHMPSAGTPAAIRKRAFDALFRFADSLCTADAEAFPIILGDMNAGPDDPLLLRARNNPFAALTQYSYIYEGRRWLPDQIFPIRGEGALQCLRAGVFVRDYMLHPASSPQRGTPRRTFGKGRYAGGASDHLPVYAVFCK